MTTKLLVNGEAGAGKTSLLKDLDGVFVISIDGKDFPLAVPHVTYKENVTFKEIINGYETTVEHVEDGKLVTEVKQIKGIIEILDMYVEKMKKFPTTIVVDSVSKAANNIIEKGNTDFENFDIHSHIKRELGLLNSFITEYLEPRCENIIILNHVVVKDGVYQQTGTGNFKDKGGFYAEVDESITIVALSDKKRKVMLTGSQYQARTLLDLPPSMNIAYVHPSDPTKSEEDTKEHFNLQRHLDKIKESRKDVSDWCFS